MIFAPIRLAPDAPGQTPARDRTIFSLLSAVKWVQRYVDSDTKAQPRWAKLIAILNAAAIGQIDLPEARAALHIAMMAEGWVMPDELEQPDIFPSTPTDLP
jgi:hypothetical protein